MTEQTIRDRILILIERLADGVNIRFAEMIGATSKNIDDWVNKGHTPKGEQLLKFYSKLNINLNWLLAGDGEMFLKKKEYPLGEDKPLHSPVIEAMIEYGYTKEEREYSHKLFHIFQDKDESAVNAIKTSIDAFIKTPDKRKIAEKKNKAG